LHQNVSIIFIFASLNCRGQFAISDIWGMEGVMMTALGKKQMKDVLILKGKE
jgi:hypothetical protein